jgi:hypothetical protein
MRTGKAKGCPHATLVRDQRTNLKQSWNHRRSPGSWPRPRATAHLLYQCDTISYAILRRRHPWILAPGEENSHFNMSRPRVRPTVLHFHFAYSCPGFCSVLSAITVSQLFGHIRDKTNESGPPPVNRRGTSQMGSESAPDLLQHTTA